MKYIKLFESHGYDKLKKDFTSLFYRKVCEYGNVVGHNYYDKGQYEIEFTENNEPFFFSIIIMDEISDIFLILKSSPSNESVFYNMLQEYFDNSKFFEKKVEFPYLVALNNNKYKILGTAEEVEEDLKDLETRTQANKYNL